VEGLDGQNAVLPPEQEMVVDTHNLGFEGNWFEDLFDFRTSSGFCWGCSNYRCFLGLLSYLGS
jgi:hypothetical protein